MPRTTKTLGFSVPPTLAKEVESLARKERRTMSELFREMRIPALPSPTGPR